MIPAHKQTDPDKKPGQVVYGFDRHPYMKHSTQDQTLGDYIARKTQQDAFNAVKPTFEEWWKQVGMVAYGNYVEENQARDIWNAANAVTS